MPRLFTTSALVTKIKQRTDLENQENISDSEWKSMLSTAYAELYSLVAETGLRYFETTYAIASTGAVSYTEPQTHLATVGIDYVASSGERHALYELMPQERNRFSGQTGKAVAFAIVDDQIFLYPKPPSGQNYELVYVPQPPDIGTFADGDYIDVVTPDGEAFLIWNVTVQALAKEEADVSLARAERELHRERVTEWAIMRSLYGARRRQVDDSDESAYDAGDYWGRRPW